MPVVVRDVNLKNLLRRTTPALGALALLSTAPSLSASKPDLRFGAMTHFAHGWHHDWAWVAAMRSIGTVRDELYWNTVETQKGVYAFPQEYDNYMDTLRVAGISPLIVLSFENANYDGGNTPYTAEGIAGYGNYGVEVLRRYGDQIKAVEIWNEYNGSFCKGPAISDRAGTYAKMLAGAYSRIKAERPDVTVLGGSTIGTPLPYWEKLIKAGALASMDALSVHPYRYNALPEGIEKDITALQDLVKQYNNGQTKPIWVSEVGWSIQENPGPGEMAIDEATQAKFLVRAYTLLLSAGVERVYWYLLRDDENFALGLTKADATPKLAAYAMEVMSEKLSGAKFVRRELTDEFLYSLLFAQDDGTPVRVIWSLKPVTVFSLGATTVTDIVGNYSAAPTTLDLTDSPLFVEGPFVGLPPRTITEVELADSVRDFSAMQGYRGWSFGAFVGSSTNLELLTNYEVTDWTQVWGGVYPWLSVSTGDQHPSTTGSQPISAVRRWTSTYEGSIRVVGQFQCSPGGDGVGVSVFVDGVRVIHQSLGGGNAVSAPLDFVQTVRVGSRLDFAVDPGPGNDIAFDATALRITISAN